MLGPGLADLATVLSHEARIGQLVDGWWWRVVTGSGTVVPDGAVDLLWLPGRVPFLAGPDVVPRPVELPSGFALVAVRLRPGVAGAVLGDGVDRVVGRQVPLDEVWSRADVDRLQDELGRAAAPGRGVEATARAAAGALARAVDRRVPDDWSPDPIARGAIAAIRAGARPEAGDLGSRQLRRRFTAAIGYGPALYRRIVRLDRFTDLLAAKPERSLAELAVTAGFFDQAHLNRDCRQLLGHTPGQLRPTPTP